MGYALCAVSPKNRRLNELVDQLLEQEGIQRDQNLDYTCALLNEEGMPVATGSCFRDTLRCLAADSRHQGEGLMADVVFHLTEYQLQRGNTHLFLFTKNSTAPIFASLGFTAIAEIPGKLVFMENRRTGFANYLQKLQKETPAIPVPGEIGAVVLNANPFTLGHQYLLEQASKRCSLVHVFIVSEDVSLFPAKVREQLVQEGTAHLTNLVYHRTGSYLLSANTFPSYFLKDAALVAEGHARLDAALFARIAEALGITRRFVGEEPTSLVTDLYNRTMAECLPAAGIALEVFPRKQAEEAVISASTVRAMLQAGKLEETRAYLPAPTWNWLHSPAAEPVLEAIRTAGEVRHH